ncbi:MAG: hypothetical protein V3V29_02820 [Acidimicrobiia bacterium]
MTEQEHGMVSLEALEDHPLMHRLLEGGDETGVVQEAAAAMLHCDLDGSPPAWRERLDAYRAAALQEGRADIVDVLDRLKKAHQEWFGMRR